MDPESWVCLGDATAAGCGGRLAGLAPRRAPAGVAGGSGLGERPDLGRASRLVAVARQAEAGGSTLAGPLVAARRRARRVGGGRPRGREVGALESAERSAWSWRRDRIARWQQCCGQGGVASALQSIRALGPLGRQAPAAPVRPGRPLSRPRPGTSHCVSSTRWSNSYSAHRHYRDSGEVSSSLPHRGARVGRP